jgi:hypothetical protein
MMKWAEVMIAAVVPLLGAVPKTPAVGEVLQIITAAGEVPPNSSDGTESEVFLRLIHTQSYRIEKKDEGAFLSILRDKKRDLPARLCAARFLLDLDNQEARRFIITALDRKRTADMHEAAHVLYMQANAPDKTWAIGQMIRVLGDDRLLKPLAGSGLYRGNVFSLICIRLGENLKAREAVDSLLGVIQRNPDRSEAALALGQIA